MYFWAAFRLRRLVKGSLSRCFRIRPFARRSLIREALVYEATKMPMIRLIVIFIKSIRAREISLDRNEKANKIIDELANKSLEYMIWYLSLTDYQLSIASENFMYNAGLLDAEVRLMEKYKSEELAKHYSEQLDQLYNEYVARMKGK